VIAESGSALLEPVTAIEVQSGHVQLTLTPDLTLTAERGIPARITTLVALAVVGAVVLLGVFDRARLDAGTDSLVGCDLEWMVLAAAGVVIIWVAGATTQLGAMVHRPPLGRLLAVQIAGSFANHLLPAGAGGIAINLRFLRRQGLSRQAAIGAQALNHAAGVIAHLVLFTGALLLAPRVVQDAHPRELEPRLAVGHAVTISLLVGCGCLALAGAGWILRRRFGRSSRGSRTQLLGGLRNELPALLGILRNPACGLKLWAGSFLTPLVHAGMLVAVVRGLSIPLPAVTVVVVYLVASTLSGLIPSPGGLGALDVTLTAGLVAGGAPAGLAIGAVMAYRLITVWVPLIPGALVLGVLLRRRII
jgi:uncharacterized membrane protein YbhN (UPF0104 family)